MIDLTYGDIAASKPFRFLVGPDKKEFTMHAELVARLSKPLETLVNGKMKEAKEAMVELPEVDVITFVRFFQFAYTGNYTMAALAQSVQSPPPVSIPQQVEDPPPDKGLFSSLEKKKKKKKSYDPFAMEELEAEASKPSFFDDAWYRFKKTTFSPLEKRQTPAGSPSVASTSHSALSLHAKIYVLADYYDIEALMALSLEELHQGLAALVLTKDRIDDVVTLLEYCFCNTVDKGSSKDRLRTLMTSYAASRLDTLWGSEHFQEALERYADLSKAIIGELYKGLTR